MSETGSPSPSEDTNEPSPSGEELTGRRRSRSWSRTEIATVVALLALACGLRFFDLASPARQVFDEQFYAPEACGVLEPLGLSCGDYLVTPHPPVGKWVIAAGTFLIGPSSSGARTGPAVLGTLSVLIVYLLARKILRSNLAAFVAAGLLAVDFLHLVMSRVAMLDVSASFFILLAFLFCLHDRETRAEPASLSAAAGTPLMDRQVSWRGIRNRWRFFAGLAAGLALATKWSAAPALVGLVAVAFYDAYARTTGALRRERMAATLAAEGKSAASLLIVLPLVVYMMSFGGEIDGSWLRAPWTEGSWLSDFYERQAAIVKHHRALRSGSLPGATDHAYASPPWSWPLLKRPIPYIFRVSPQGYKEILALGNPFVWWPALFALLLMATRSFTRRGSGGSHRFILLGFGATYLFWPVLTPTVPNAFFYYMLPAVPFMCLALAWVAKGLQRRRGGRVGVAVYLALTIASFAFFFPILAWRQLPADDWRARMLFRSCGPFHSTSAAKPFRYPPRYDDEVLPYRTSEDGWCWI